MSISPYIWHQLIKIEDDNDGILTSTHTANQSGQGWGGCANCLETVRSSVA